MLLLRVASSTSLVLVFLFFVCWCVFAADALSHIELIIELFFFLFVLAHYPLFFVAFLS